MHSLLSGIAEFQRSPIVLSEVELDLLTEKPRPRVGSLESSAFERTRAVSDAKSSRGDESVGAMEFVNADDLNSGRDERTTYMIRRLPRYLSVEQLSYLLASTGLLKDAADLVYVPIFTGKAHANRGYAFINFRSPQLGALFLTVVKHSPETELSRQLCKCDIVYAHIQSKTAMVANLSRLRDGWHQPSLPPGLFYCD